MLDYQNGNLHKKDWICSHCNRVVFGYKKLVVNVVKLNIIVKNIFMKKVTGYVIIVKK
jgi:hypothetical protein